MREARHRHSAYAGRSPLLMAVAGWRGVLAVIAALAVLGAVAVGWLLLRDGSLPRPQGLAGASCDEPVVAVVATTPDHAELVRAAAQAYGEGEGRSLSPCVEIAVATVDRAEDVAPRTAEGSVAAVVDASPEPTETARQAQAGLRFAESVPVARTMSVVAMPRPMAEALGWPRQEQSWSSLARVLVDPEAWTALDRPELGDVSVSLSDPVASGSSRAAVLAVAASAVGQPVDALALTDAGSQAVQGSLLALDRQVGRQPASQSELLEALRAADDAGELLETTSAAMLDEQAVWSFNQAGPNVPLAALYPTDGSLETEVSYTLLSGGGVGRAEQDAAERFRDYLLSEDGQRQVVGLGYRSVTGVPSSVLTEDAGLSPDGAPGELALPPDDVVAAVSDGWARLQNPGRFLVVVDVSGSMRDEVAGTGRTKLQFAQEAAVQGMQLVPGEAEIGLWEFSTGLDGDADHRELVPVGEIAAPVTGGTRLELLVTGVNGLTPREDTGLYDTALAAHRSMAESYQPGEPNVVVLLTDGRNDDEQSITLDELVSTIEDERDEDRPVQFLTIAYGSDADTAALARLADATGGSAYTSPNPADIGEVFFQALTSG